MPCHEQVWDASRAVNGIRLLKHIWHLCYGAAAVPPPALTGFVAVPAGAENVAGEGGGQEASG